MRNNKTLISLTRTRSPKPKQQRKNALDSLGEAIDWYSFAIRDSLEAAKDDQVRGDILSIIKRQKKTVRELEIDLATALTTSVKNHTLAILGGKFQTLIRERYQQLLNIESIPAAGGRKRNVIVWNTAKREYERWEAVKGKPPSSGTLSKLVEAALKNLNGEGRADGNLYLSPRNATLVINAIRGSSPNKSSKN